MEHAGKELLLLVQNQWFNVMQTPTKCYAIFLMLKKQANSSQFQKMLENEFAKYAMI